MGLPMGFPAVRKGLSKCAPLVPRYGLHTPYDYVRQRPALGGGLPSNGVRHCCRPLAFLDTGRCATLRDLGHPHQKWELPSWRKGCKACQRSPGVMRRRSTSWRKPKRRSTTLPPIFAIFGRCWSIPRTWRGSPAPLSCRATSSRRPSRPFSTRPARSR
mgnify:CR=1 FL=1